MKTALLALALLLPPCLSHAQNPNPKKNDGLCADDNCLQQQFPYTFCKGGETVIKCSADPNNEPGLKFMKIQLPIEFTYLDYTLQPEVTGGDDVIKFYQGSDTNFAGYPVFIGANMRKIVEAAAKRWSTPDLCPPQGPDAEYPPCRITVRWSFRNDDFDDGAILSSPAKTYRAFNPENCSVVCSESFIVLNQQPPFLRPDAYGRPTHFFGTERNNYGYIPGDPYAYTDAYTALVHEFGHMLGFAHTNEAPCGDPNSIMKPAWQSRETGDLTWADNCMFLKAYCCKKTQTIVWGSDPHLPPDDHPDHTKTLTQAAPAPGLTGFRIVPNPATEAIITLSLYEPVGQDGGSIRIVDAAGSTVLDQRLQAGSGRSVSVDVGTLPNGFYMLQLVQGGQIHGRKFLIRH